DVCWDIQGILFLVLDKGGGWWGTLSHVNGYSKIFVFFTSTEDFVERVIEDNTFKLRVFQTLIWFFTIMLIWFNMHRFASKSNMIAFALTLDLVFHHAHLYNDQHFLNKKTMGEILTNKKMKTEIVIWSSVTVSVSHDKLGGLSVALGLWIIWSAQGRDVRGMFYLHSLYIFTTL
ncbi:hypothetical protein ACJX0J_028881, partial [Zea mays]